MVHQATRMCIVLVALVVSVLLSFVPVAAQTGEAVVTTVDGSGGIVTNTCSDVFTDGGGGRPDFYVIIRCDTTDPTVTGDGVTVYQGVLAPGNYVLIHSIVPDGFVVGERTPFSVSANAVTEVRVVLVQGGATVSFLMRDADGAVIPNLCLSVNQSPIGGDGGYVTSECDLDDRDGTIVFRGLAPGSYVATGFSPDAGREPDIEKPFTVAGGTNDQTVTVTLGEPSLIEQLIAVLIAILQQILGG